MTTRQPAHPSAHDSGSDPDGGVEALVASAGGHLTQLLALRDSLGLSKEHSLWVTYNSPQGRELAGREPVVFGHGPSTRNARIAVRNAALAHRLFMAHRVTRVVSTGAGIAVPFLLQAAARGIDALYVESATRSGGPSLSGRILERVPGVLCAAQWSWGRRGWWQVASVFDGLESQPAAGQHREENGRRILVALGTHSCYRFDRLVSQVERVVRGDDTVVWQVGATPPPAGATTVVDDIGPAQFGDLVDGCDVVIGHGGLGTALTALRMGRYPILVPRRRAHGEHVDDHQQELVRALHAHQLALKREADEIVPEDLTVAAARRVTRSEPATSHAAEPDR